MLKGVGAQNPAPSSKHDGYLSIENKNQIVFRTLAGRQVFTGIITQKTAKIKQVDDPKPNKFKAKFTAVVQGVAWLASTEKSMAIEHLEAKFMKSADMANFETLYKKVASQPSQ